MSEDGESLPPSEGKDGESLPPSEGKDGESVPPSEGKDGESLPPSEGKDGESVPPSEGKDGESVPPSEVEGVSGRPRIAREKRTVEVMVRFYCRKLHSGVDRNEMGLCPECSDLLEFSNVRLDRCPFADAKPTCANCSVHCYSPKRGMREGMRAVMRYSGPRMMLHHPVMAIHHILDGRKHDRLHLDRQRDGKGYSKGD